MDKDKIELILKSLTRTDSYLNYANTKSTILLTLASAILTIIGVNLSKVLPSNLHELSGLSLFFFMFFLIIGVLLNVASIIKSLGSMAPFITESEKENIFSFVDIVHYYKDGIDYFNKLYETKYLDLGKQLSILNYTLSDGLIIKYKGQKKSIMYLKLSLLSFFTSISVPWVESSLQLFKNEESGVILLSLVIFFLILIIVIMVFIVTYLLLIGRKTK
ncbi:hypothetical protein [Pectobacterium versatile]|uniref:hypothetical protein n=1 Tax=Pectobacterium versatile TaxID=2488639 RepID=UPI00102ECE49|nr:hypothetical protein [Pectobacterium versatile]TAI92072.1 hypothetical protein EG331_04000 [Pectobacterium versatile]